jgi:hypothetical protein
METETPTPTVWACLNRGEIHRVIEANPLKGEDDGLVSVLVESLERPSLYWTTALAEDLFVHPDGFTALMAALAWDVAKYGD